MLIHLLSENKTKNGKALNFPIQNNKRLLLEMGVKFRFFWDEPYAKDLLECDALWINSKVFRTWWTSQKKNSLIERLEYYQNRASAVVYFDTTDSSGTLQHEILPFVSKYYKSFLLKNKKLYLNRHYGGRVFTDYYHNNYAVKDSEEIPKELGPITDEKHLLKIGLSWNHVLGYIHNHHINFMNFSTNRFISPEKKRSIPVSCRIGINHKRETVRFQREKIRNMLSEMNIASERITCRQFLKELRNSKIGISPFGNGEFAYRDYEIIKSGCLLFKPDMSHLETWPDLYIDNETYVSFKWDFSDFKEKLNVLLNESLQIKEYAQKAQARFKLYGQGQKAKEELCTKVVKMAMKHHNDGK